jgi:ABC-2 type transport system ATP-binding protein
LINIGKVFLLAFIEVNQMNANNKPVVKVKKLMKQYPGIKAVDEISFEVHKGEIFGLLGPNGAGKSTTIECIEGLRNPDSGEITVLDLNPRNNAYELRERIGVQFQSAALPDRIKVWEALDLFSAFYQRPVDWNELLGKMGLLEKRNAYLNKLSGGQRQRIFIALALINDPELVFLDELTTGLDPQARRAMWALVKEIRDQGKTVFLTTHFMEEAERLCDRVAIIDQGKIIAIDTPKNLIAALGAEHRIIFEVEDNTIQESLKSVKGVQRVEQIGEKVIVYGKKDGLVSNVVNVLETGSIQYHDLRTEQPTLEDVFLALTGKEMRN